MIQERDWFSDEEPEDDEDAWFEDVQNFSVGGRDFVDVTSLLAYASEDLPGGDAIMGLYTGKMRTLMHPTQAMNNPPPASFGTLFFWSDCPPQDGEYGPAGRGGYELRS